jgi:probable rRNA maturation factor
MAQLAEASSGEVWLALGLSRAGLGRFLRAAQTAVGLHGEVAVLMSDDRRLRRLNREFRGKDTATDVLSFPVGAEIVNGHAGDLAISIETAARQAREQGHSLRDELRVLLLHGILHLAGMDHETDRGEMAEREAELRRRFGLPNGLIARAGKATARATASALNAKGAKVQRKVRKGKQTRRGVAA